MDDQKRIPFGYFFEDALLGKYRNLKVRRYDNGTVVWSGNRVGDYRENDAHIEYYKPATNSPMHRGPLTLTAL